MMKKKIKISSGFSLEKVGSLQLVSERGCDSVDLLSMESIMNRVS